MTRVFCWILACAIAMPANARDIKSFSELSGMMLFEPSSSLVDDMSVGAKVERTTNPARLYPPSCLSHPLPTSPTGYGLAGPGSLRNIQSGLPVSSTLAFWRIPCSSTKAAFVITVGSSQGLIELPRFTIRQDGKEWTARLAHEPNTRQAFVLTHLGGLVTTYVVEIGEPQYLSQGAPDLNRAFDISADYAGGVQVLPLTRFESYQSNSYTSVPTLVPLNGRMTGAYFQPGRGGEGILLEVAEAGSTSLIVVSWYTFDAQGFPFWLVGSAVYTPGATSVTVDLAGKSGGAIGGQFEPSQLQDLPWGSITLRFPNCNTLDFSFQSTHSIPGVPIGSGARAWTRLTSVNGFACE